MKTSAGWAIRIFMRLSPCYAAFLLLPLPALAQAPSLHDAIAAAWQRLPDRAGVDARRQAATARSRAGRAFFPNAPYAQDSYVNDKAGSN